MSDDVPPDEQAARRQRDRHERQEEILSEFESAVDDVDEEQ